MPGEKHGILATIETYVDMLINASLIYFTYFVTCYFNSSAPAYTYGIKIFVGVASIIVGESLVHQIITKKYSTIEYRPTKNVKQIWSAKFVSFVILIIIALIFAPASTG